MNPSHRVHDQADLPTFRLLLVVQIIATIVFGLVPWLLPATFASLTGFSGHDEVIYRLAGAATTGYLTAAAVALIWRVGWLDLRIPLVATFTFTALAAFGSLEALREGDTQWIVVVVLLAAATFAVLAAYWLRRDQGEPSPAGASLTTPIRAIVALATLSAAVFGLLPILAPAQFASLFGLVGTDVWIYRMAGAACFGYATAGLLTFRAEGLARIRVQNLAALTFNALAAVASWSAVAQGTGGRLAPVVAVAASAFTIGLGWIASEARQSA